jgi:hypothetical protein
VVGSCNVFGLALLVLSATGGGSAVRAEDPATLQSSVLEKIAAGIEQRVADLQASVAAFADSFTARRIAAQELCVGDGTGAQTCITKAQLDGLLRGALQTGQAPAAIEPDQTEQTASADAAPLALVVAPPETLPATEPSGAALAPAQPEESRGGQAAAAPPEVAALPEAPALDEAEAVPEAATAAKMQAVPEVGAAGEVEELPETTAIMPSAAQPATGQPGAALSEAAAPPEAAAAAAMQAVPEVAASEVEELPETTAVIPSAAQPATGQPGAALSEAAASPEALVPSQPSEPADNIIAANAKSQSVIMEERAEKQEELAQRGSTETNSAAEVKAAPPEAAPVSQRAE